MRTHLRLQTEQGIANAIEFVYMTSQLRKLCEHVFTLLHVSEVAPDFPWKLSCHVICEGFRRALPHYALRRVSGYCGVVDSEQKVQYTHSWLVARCAPGWVVDIAPIYGALSPHIVSVQSDGPWAKMYREAIVPDAQLDVVEEQTAAWLSQVIVRMYRAHFPEMSDLIAAE